MKRATAGWVRKAEHDFLGAVDLRGKRPPLHDLVCFHSPQCAEKYLKALIEEQGLFVHKTHDLLRLLTELLPHYPSLARVRRGLAVLTDHAVDVRYPGDTPTRCQAESAVRWAEKCLESNQYQCFDARCGSQGAVLDLWSALHQRDLCQSALDLVAAFGLEPSPGGGTEKRNGWRAELRPTHAITRVDAWMGGVRARCRRKPTKKPRHHGDGA